MGKLRLITDRYGYVFAVFCVAAATAVFHPGRDYFAKGQWALLYLLIVGLVAGLSGVRPALLAAALAFLCWNFFFLPPYYRFVVHDPKDWLSLLVFLVVAAAIGLQTGRLREREAQALARERELALLNDFSAHLVSDAALADMAETMLAEVRQITGARCAALFLPDEKGSIREVSSLADESCPQDPFVAEAAAWVHREAKAIGLPHGVRQSEMGRGAWPVSVEAVQAGARSARRDIVIPLQTARQQEGVLYVGEREDGSSYSVSGVRLLIAVANQAAAFLERKHLQAAATQADALREADRLKSTLVSSVSHELKTPIASVTATVTNLLEEDVDWNPDSVRSELEAVRDDLDRLNSSIGSLLDLSRLESAAWEPVREWYELGEVVGTAISRIPMKQRGRISFALPDDLPQVNVDFVQWARVLQNLLENALAYSPPESPVRLGAEAGKDDVRIWVEDEGPGIADKDKERVFDKFYRGQPAANAPAGTGLGLAVTREIVRFHGGRIWIEDGAPHGARFVVSLPQQEEATTQ